jgi:hypothetical protein
VTLATCQVGNIGSSDNAIDKEAWDDQWQNVRGRVKAKGVTVGDGGAVDMKFQHTSTSKRALEDQDGDDNNLDSIWNMGGGGFGTKTKAVAIKDDESDGGASDLAGSVRVAKKIKTDQPAKSSSSKSSVALRNPLSLLSVAGLADLKHVF